MYLLLPVVLFLALLVRNAQSSIQLQSKASTGWTHCKLLSTRPTSLLSLHSGDAITTSTSAPRHGLAFHAPTSLCRIPRSLVTRNSKYSASLTRLHLTPLFHTTTSVATKVALSCLIPTSLGFVRYEYGVSYGYGLSVAISASWFLQALSSAAGTTSSTTMLYHHWHAAALLFYGVRLSIFLLYREVFLERFRKMRERIETKRTIGNTQPNRFVSRVPFVLGCALLYNCLVAPLFITAAASSTAIPSVSSTHLLVLKGCIAATWCGFAVAAIGDLQKSICKAISGPDTLVTGGVFYMLRHPNYTGEAFGWTANFVTALVAATTCVNIRSTTALMVALVASIVGWVGIIGVLAMAATELEKRHQGKYGNDPKYKAWMQRSWAGPTLPKAKAEKE